MNKQLRIAVILAIGLVIWFLPVPAGLSVKAWHLFAIVVATIIGYILQPVPMGAIGLTSVVMCVLTKTTSLNEALSGYSNSTIWLVVAAILFARGFINSGLGTRIAYTLVKRIGGSSIKLGYAMLLSDLIIAPATPSNTARAGGILFPIVRSLASAFGSEANPETRKKLGAYLTQTLYQSVVVTSMMFITAIASNSLVVTFAKQVTGIEISWFTWAVAASVPGVICLACIPLIMHRLYPPEIQETSDAKRFAAGELAKMGPMAGKEKIVLFIFIAALILWATSSITQLNATVVAILAVVVMIWLGAMSYKEAANESMAWDNLLWMGTLIGLASLLEKFGFIKWLATLVAGSIAGVSWTTALSVLALIYIATHYFFAATSSHVTAMYAAFLTVAISAGAPPYYAALFLGFASVLCASLTHYAMGPSPVLFAPGYVTQTEWWKLGLIFAMFNGVIWFGLGPFWWKLIGLW
ncbi:MAG: anion permease [Sporomusaceae bacterium]|nr:anion permease [Sporomusaceae bacterium]